MYVYPRKSCPPPLRPKRFSGSVIFLAAMFFPRNRQKRTLHFGEGSVSFLGENSLKGFIPEALFCFYTGSAGGLSQGQLLRTITSRSQFEETLMQNMMNKLDFNVPLWPVNVSHLASITVAGLRLNICFMPCVFGWYASNSSSASSSSVFFFFFFFFLKKLICYSFLFSSSVSPSSVFFGESAMPTAITYL